MPLGALVIVGAAANKLAQQRGGWDRRVILHRGDAAQQFVVLQPYASRVPYETWIVPKMHYASFGLFPAMHLADLSIVLKDSLLCLYRGLDNPAFNLMVDTTNTEDEADPSYHWHIRIVPRLTTIAGFEIGSGIYINTAIPEDTTRFMKQLANSLPEDECASFKQKG